MDSLGTILFTISRIGMGMIFLFFIVTDITTRSHIFNLMEVRKIPAPWLLYIGAISLKAITGLGLIFNVYTFWSALLLALYVFIANMIFNNFWSAPKEQLIPTLLLFLTNLAVCFGLMAISGAKY